MAEWTASLAASHAPTCPLPADKPGSTETPADCISSTSESFAKFSHDGSLLKTSRQFSLFQQEEPYCENLPRSGSMRNGELFERLMLVPRIDGTGLSYWHTPRANECEEGAETFVKRNGDRGAHCFSGLTDQIANWPTPRSEDSESCGNHPGAVDSLTGASRHWATPTTAMTTGAGTQGRNGGMNLQTMTAHWPPPKSRDSKSAEGEAGMMRHSPDLNMMACHSFRQALETPPHGSESSPNGRGSRRRLNPNFVDWLMSLPPGWTDYAPVETELWFCKVRMHLASLLNERG